MTIMFVLALICVVGLFYCLMMLARNQVVYEFQMYLIEHFLFKGSPYEKGPPDYDALMHDFSCWTFLQFEKKYVSDVMNKK